MKKTLDYKVTKTTPTLVFKTITPKTKGEKK